MGVSGVALIKNRLVCSAKAIDSPKKIPSSRRAQGNAPLSHNPLAADILQRSDRDEPNFLSKHPLDMKRYLDVQMFAASLPPQTEARHATLQAA
jgi:hypothetical protein